MDLDGGVVRAYDQYERRHADRPLGSSEREREERLRRTRREREMDEEDRR